MNFLKERRWFETWLSFSVVFLNFISFYWRFSCFFTLDTLKKTQNSCNFLLCSQHKNRILTVCVRFMWLYTKLMLKKLKLEARAHDVYLFVGHRTSCTTLITFTLCLMLMHNFFYLFKILWRIFLSCQLTQLLGQLLL